jgi:hypothetical protein
MEQRLVNIELGIERLDTRFKALENKLDRLSSEFAEFVAFTKAHFERQEKRLENIEGAMHGIQQSFLFNNF